MALNLRKVEATAVDRVKLVFDTPLDPTPALDKNNYGFRWWNRTDSERAFRLDPDVNIAAGAYVLAESYDTINRHNRGKVNRDKPERQVSESDRDNFAIYGYHRGGAELSAVLKNLARDATPESPLTWDKFAGAPEKYKGSAEGVQYVNDVNSRLNPPTEGGLPKDAGNT